MRIKKSKKWKLDPTTNDQSSLTNRKIDPSSIGDFSEESIEELVVHQQAIAKVWDLLHTPDLRYKVLYGGRNSGKSWGVADYVVEKCLESRKRVLCTREFQASIQTSSYTMISDTIRRRGLEEYFLILQDSIKCITTGSEIFFKGLQEKTISAVRSTEGIDICWVEEAHSISEKSWRVLIPTIRKEGSEIIITFNPDLEDDPTYQRFVLKNPPRCGRVKVNYYDNPFLSQEIKEEIVYDRENDEELYEHIWEGETRKSSSAQIFKKKCVVREFDENEFIKKGLKNFYHGLDHGFGSDPLAGIECFIWDRCLWIGYEVYGVGIEIDDIPQRLVDGIPRLRGQRWKIYADSARPETNSYLNKNVFEVKVPDEYGIKQKRKMGFNVQGVGKKTEIEDGIEYLRKFKRIYIHPRCKHMIQEAKMYKYKVNRLTEEVLPEIEDRNNHCWDAVRYALHDLIKSQNFDWFKYIDKDHE